MAEGFRSPTTGAAGLGMSGARLAFIDDASATWHNPANLVDLKAWEASAEPTFVHHSVQYRSAHDGSITRTEDPWKILPAIFAGGPLNDRVAAGIGVTVPYGLAIKWDEAGAFRYTAPHYVDLKTFNVNPTLAFRLGDRVRLGLGLDAMWSELHLKQIYPWGLAFGNPGLPDGELRARGDGVGYSGNVGLTVEPVDGHRIAFTARLPMQVDYEGHFTGTEFPLSPDSSLRTDFKSQIKFPTVLGLGYGIRVTDTVRLEANAEWVQFSRFETLNLEVPASLPGLATQYPQDWRDTFTFGAGGEWAFSEGWRARLSYQHYQTPVPERTFSPTIPDAAQNVVTVGLGYRGGRHRLDLAYSRVFYDDRRISENQNAAYLGEYEIAVHLISLGYGFTF